MKASRIVVPCVLVAAVAACSGNIGGGQSTLPGMQNGTLGTNGVQQVASPAPTSSPQTASNVATLDAAVGAQPLPAVMGYAGTIAFPKPRASSSPSPATDATSVGVTASVNAPADAPPLVGRHRSKHDAAITPLLYVSLAATGDLTLSEYPRLEIDVPHDVAAKHTQEAYALGLFDPERDHKAYQLSVAERDLSSPAPGTSPSVVPSPTPTATTTGSPFGMPNGMGALTPPPVGAGVGQTLPPEHVAFAAVASTLTLRANRPVVFVLYASTPTASPTPSPSPSASGAPSASPQPAGTSTPVNTR